MTISEGKDDYHYVLRGTFRVTPDKFYKLVVHNVKKSTFLRLVEANDASRVLKIKSERPEDPRGMITFTIHNVELRPNMTKFKMHVEDEEFLTVVRAGGLQARYGKDVKKEDTLSWILINEPPGAKDRASILSALTTYRGLISSAPGMKQGLYGIMMPGGKEMMEMVEFVEKYGITYTAEKAQLLENTIEDLRYSVDAQEQMSALVKNEKKLITVSLAAYKKSLQWNTATFQQIQSTLSPSHGQHIEDALRRVDEIATKFDIDLASPP